jgi:G protein-coupled glucose receptor regulating Gpa2 C-term
MLFLIVLYSILFFYIRVQSKKLLQVTSSSTRSIREFPSYEENLEAGKCIRKIIPQPSHRIQTGSHQAQRKMKQISLTLFFYPTVYLVLLLPLSIARLRQFIGKDPSLNFTYTTVAIFNCQGFINVLLYTTTRKGLVSWDALFRKFNRGNSEESHISTRDVIIPSTISNKHSVKSTASFSQYYPHVPENVSLSNCQETTCAH